MKPTAETTSLDEIISVKSLTCVAKSSGVRVVDNVSFSIHKGESIGLLGESGVGKTTLFRAILQLLPESEWRLEGDIIINGQSVVGLSPKELEAFRGRMVRCIFQEPGQSLNPSLKIERQLLEAIKTITPELDEKAARSAMVEALANGGLRDPELVKGRYPGELSGGQRQRVGISMSLCRPCAILLADEPSSSLDSVTVTEMVATLMRLKKELFLGALFCVTHDLSVLGALETERVLFMHAGKMFEVGSITDVIANPGHEKLEEMVGLSKIVDRHGGRSRKESGDEAAAESQLETLATIQGLEFGFQKKSFFVKKQSLILKDVNFNIKRGEFVALVGTSGSGKSTIGSLLARLLSGFSGHITFDGMDIARLRKKQDRKKFHRTLQVVFQDPADTFDPALTMRQNLEECYIAMGLTQPEIDSIFPKMLDLLLLEERTLDEMPENLSGGQKQRYALLRAFGSEPSMIIADEPFTHLDLIAQSRLIEYLLNRKFSEENPMSCLLISHEIGIVSKLCDRIIVIDDGQVVENNLAHRIVNEAVHPATIRLIDAANMLGTLSK